MAVSPNTVILISLTSIASLLAFLRVVRDLCFVHQASVRQDLNVVVGQEGVDRRCIVRLLRGSLGMFEFCDLVLDADLFLLLRLSRSGETRER